MRINIWRFITLLLAALAMTMESAHVLELPQKMQYDGSLYTTVNGTLYRYFAIVGGAYQLGSIIAATVLAFLLRGRHRAFTWAVIGAACLWLAFGVWLGVVNPVNLEIAGVMQSSPEAVPTVWLALRKRWEYGHAAGFAIQLIGFVALLLSMLAEIPQAPPEERPRFRGWGWS